jgi:hypothetical protein
MLKRSAMKLASTVVAAGTICALGAASASAAPGWSPRTPAVPRAFTNAGPSVTTVSFGNSPQVQTLLAWKGQGNAHIFYEASPTIGVPKSWSAKAEIPGAASTQAPSIASYRDPNGRNAVLAVWRGSGGLIQLAQGETKPGQQIDWTAVSTLPKSIYDTTDAQPSVFFALDKYVAVVAYRGPFDHIRYIEGVPFKRGFNWSPSHEISTSAVASSGPAIAEQQTGTGHGQIFVFWKGQGTNQVNYSTTTDPIAPSGSVVWTPPTVLAKAVTSTTPAASALGAHGTGGLMLVYKAPHAAHLLFQVMAAGTWSDPAPVPSSNTVFAPALVRNELANTSAAGSGVIYFHTFG